MWLKTDITAVASLLISVCFRRRRRRRMWTKTDSFLSRGGDNGFLSWFHVEAPLNRRPLSIHRRVYVRAQTDAGFNLSYRHCRSASEIICIACPYITPLGVLRNPAITQIVRKFNKSLSRTCDFSTKGSSWSSSCSGLELKTRTSLKLLPSLLDLIHYRPLAWCAKLATLCLFSSPRSELHIYSQTLDMHGCRQFPLIARKRSIS